MKLKRSFGIYSAFLISLLAAFAAGFFVHAQLVGKSQDYPILEEAYSILEAHGYADLPDAPALEYGMIHGMLNAYDDPYTRFVEPVQHELSSDNLEGSYGGIGTTLDRDADGFIIFHPFPDAAAREAGIQDGDRLVKVDGIEITVETTFDEAVAAVRGPVGKEVSIEVTRPPEYDHFTYSIKRDQFPIPSVTWHLAPSDGRVGIIKVNLIAATTTDEILKAYTDLQSNGATHFVLDMRGNGGGYLESSVDISQLFLEKGIIYQEQYRGQDIGTFEIDEPGQLANIPLVVFIDGNSASATELIAGAIQVHGRAPLIGTHSYGKDSIQLIFNLEDGSSLHVTAAKWWVPGLASPIGDGGLQPDIPISDEGGDTDPYLQAAIRYFFMEQP